MNAPCLFVWRQRRRVQFEWSLVLRVWACLKLKASSHQSSWVFSTVCWTKRGTESKQTLCPVNDIHARFFNVNKSQRVEKGQSSADTLCGRPLDLWSLTFEAENWHTGYSCPVERLHQFWFFCGFSFLKRQNNRQTDRRTDGGTGKTCIAAH